MKKKLISKLIIAAVFAGLLSGCGNSITSESSFGSLMLNIENSQRSLTPSISREVTKFTVKGSGPEGISPIELDLTEQTALIENIYPGEWSFTVEALNTDGIILGSGSNTVTVTNGETTQLTIDVTELSGNGTLNLAVSWVDGEIKLPSISAILTDSSGVESGVVFTIGDDLISASFSGDYPVGNYKVTILVKDGEALVMSRTEEVLIYKDQITSGDMLFDSINKFVGELSITISTKLRKSLDLAILGIPADGIIYKTTTLSVVNNTPATTPEYEWFINGLSYGTGTSIDVDPSGDLGYCYVSVIGRDSLSISSGSVSELVDIEAYKVGDIGPSGGYIIYDDEADGVDNIIGFRYLEAAAADIGKRSWGSWDPTLVVNAQGIDVGTGIQNTLDIIAEDPALNKAADACADYVVTKNGVNYDDWFLPSINELTLMYSELHTKGLGGFLNAQYYSSTRGGSTAATLMFKTGVQWNYNTSISNYVRAVRAF